jgi:hypothetical protein
MRWRENKLTWDELRYCHDAASVAVQYLQHRMGSPSTSVSQIPTDVSSTLRLSLEFMGATVGFTGSRHRSLAFRRGGAWCAILNLYVRNFTFPYDIVPPWRMALHMAYFQLAGIFSEEILASIFEESWRRMYNPALQFAHEILENDEEARSMLCPNAMTLF